MPRDTSPARGVPPGYHAVTPWVISRDTAQLIEFTKQAFGAAELARIPGPAGGIGHAEVRIGDSVVMMFDAPEGWPDTPAFLRLYVEDGDAAYQRALQAGAAPVTEMTTLFFGDRVGRVRDPLGNICLDPGARRGCRSRRAGPPPGGPGRCRGVALCRGIPGRVAPGGERARRWRGVAHDGMYQARDPWLCVGNNRRGGRCRGSQRGHGGLAGRQLRLCAGR